MILYLVSIFSTFGVAFATAAPHLHGVSYGKDAVASGLTVMNLHLLNDTDASGAVCLDGTPAGFYFSPATSEEARRDVLGTMDAIASGRLDGVLQNEEQHITQGRLSADARSDAIDVLKTAPILSDLLSRVADIVLDDLERRKQSS